MNKHNVRPIETIHFRVEDGQWRTMEKDNTMTHKFTATQFTADQFTSAAGKAKFANDFARFIETGCRPTMFTNKLYNDIHVHFSFIAHYNRWGFFREYFMDVNDLVRFIDQFVERSYGPWSDVGNAIRDWLLTENVVTDALHAFQTTEETRNIFSNSHE